MGTILEINNWNQLVRARSDYDNLRIVVSEYNNDSFIGTRIQVVDYNTNEVYLTLLTKIVSSTVVPDTASMELQQIVDTINLYGFHIAISEPEVIPQNVLAILRGLYESGYRYIHKNYIKVSETGGHILYNLPEYRMFVCASKDADFPETYIGRRYVDLTRTPSFVRDEWDWVRPLRTYPIETILETGTVDNGLFT